MTCPNLAVREPPPLDAELGHVLAKDRPEQLQAGVSARRAHSSQEVGAGAQGPAPGAGLRAPHARHVTRGGVCAQPPDRVGRGAEAQPGEPRGDRAEPRARGPPSRRHGQ